jgi:glycolate oxidase iron-sulfur subunit
VQHTISLPELTSKIGPQVQEMADAVSACVHCGFCLAVCPTYLVLGEEMDSPRGRIVLMKSILEGNLTLPEAMPYLDRCLGCLACVTVCPSGVRYGDLITPFRAYARSKITRPMMKRTQHALVKVTLPYPSRFRSVAVMGRLVKPLAGALPDEMRPIADLLTMLPGSLPPAHKLPTLVKAAGKRRARVALLAGCVQQVLAPEINWASLRVLAKNGVEVVIPADQGCCGALLIHTGDHAQARTLARRNLQAFPRDVDAILTNAAGCGSGMKEYGLLFKGQPEEELVQEFSSKVEDISQFLADLEVTPPPPLPQPLKIAYHDACHLAHAQGITASPRQLLAAIPNLTLLEIPDGTTCCGSAGVYNLEQPKIATQLGKRKAENIIQSGADAVVTGNIGCIVQIRNHLGTMGKSLPIFHTFELLDMAYGNGD